MLPSEKASTPWWEGEKPRTATVCLSLGKRGKTSAQSSLWFAAVAPFLSCCSCQAAALCVEAVGTLLQSGSEVGAQHHVPLVGARGNLLLQYCELVAAQGFERALIGQPERKGAANSAAPFE